MWLSQRTMLILILLLKKTDLALSWNVLCGKLRYHFPRVSQSQHSLKIALSRWWIDAVPTLWSLVIYFLFLHPKHPGFHLQSHTSHFRNCSRFRTLWEVWFLCHFDCLFIRNAYGQFLIKFCILWEMLISGLQTSFLGYCIFV